jgi:RNA polymerase sigma-70 factor (ECF subfamily)
MTVTHRGDACGLVRARVAPRRYRDAEVFSRCRRGDESAWPELVRNFAPYVHAIAVGAYRLSEPDAEDVFQEVFLRTWQNLGRLKSDEAIRPWIAQLTRRLCVDRLRSAARELSRDDLDRSPSLAARDAAAQIDEALIVREAISRLPAIQQEIIERVFVRGESHATIASALGIAEGTVASRICRARERLRSLLTEPES